jgi:hypothetical protein
MDIGDCERCAGERVATTSDEWDTPLCQRCKDQLDELAWERLYGSSQSRTVREPREVER